MPADRLDPNEHAWVAVDVVAEALDISIRHVPRIARAEGWRIATTRSTSRGRPKKQYLWPDVVRTYNHRKDTPQ